MNTKENGSNYNTHGMGRRMEIPMKRWSIPLEYEYSWNRHEKEDGECGNINGT